MSETQLTVDELLAHAGWLRGLARRLVGDAGADDLVQEVWLRAAKQPPTRRDSPKGWLKTVLRSVYVRQLERGSASRAREQQVAATEALPSAAELLGRAEAQRTLVEEVVRLDEPFRQTLLLHYFEGHSAAEIARRSGEKSSTVRSRLARGVELLRMRLDARPGGRASWLPGMALLVAPQVGVAGLSPLSLGGLLMWKSVLLATAAVLLAWFGISMTRSSSTPLEPVAPTITRTADVTADPAESAAESVLADVPGERSSASRTSQPRPEGRRVVGRIVDPDGRPVPGAEVELDGLAALVADADGRFSAPIDASFRAQQVLRATAPGFVAAEPTLTAEWSDERATFDLGTLTLDRAAQVSGVVVDDAGAAIEGAEIRLEPLGTALMDTVRAEQVGDPVAVTTVAGAFRIEELPVGPWRLRVDHPDHPTTIVDGVSRASGMDPRPLEIALPKGGVVGGRVNGVVPEGARVVGVRVGAGIEPNRARSARVESDGTFTLRGLVPDADYEVVVAEASDALARGGGLSNRVRTRPGDSSVQLTVGGADSLEGTRGAGLRFRLVDAESGEPIDDFDASYRDGTQGFLRALEAGGSIDASGVVAFRDLSAKKGEEGSALRLEAPGYEFFEMGGIALREAEWTDLGEIRLRPAPKLRVRVVSDATSEPIEDAEIEFTGFPARRLPPTDVLADACTRCHGPTADRRGVGVDGTGRASCTPLYQAKVYTPFSWSGETDGEGEDLVELPSDVALKASITHPDFVDVELDAAAFARQEELIVRMFQGGDVVVEVTEADGSTRAGLAVTSDDGRTVKTDAEGRAFFEQVATGMRTFNASRTAPAPQMVVIGGAAPDPEGVSEKVLVRAGEVATLKIQLEASGALLGRVLEQGTPLAGAALRLDPKSTGGAQVMTFGGPSQANATRTRSDGAFRFADLEPGPYTLTVSHPERAMVETIDVDILPGENARDVSLSLTSIEGVAVDQSGRPLANADVSVRSAGGSSGGQATMTTMQMIGADGTPVSMTSSRSAPTVKTDGKGRFTLRGVRAGRDLVLLVQGKGGVSGRETVDALADGERLTGMRVVVDAYGTLRFKVMVGGAMSEAFPRAGLREVVDGKVVGAERIVSGGPAVAVVDDIAPGVYEVSAFLSNDERSDPERITIEAGKTVTKTFGP